MLYDPKWEVKTDPFTLPDFIAWLETHNPAQKYDFDDCNGHCLMGLYMAARTRPWGHGLIKYGSNYWLSCEEIFGSAWNAGVLTVEPHTFGAALERARAAL